MRNEKVKTYSCDHFAYQGNTATRKVGPLSTTLCGFDVRFVEESETFFFFPKLFYFSECLINLVHYKVYKKIQL